MQLLYSAQDLHNQLSLWKKENTTSSPCMDMNLQCIQCLNKAFQIVKECLLVAFSVMLIYLRMEGRPASVAVIISTI